MSKSATLIVLGIIIALSPYVGLPSSWLSIILVLCGAAVFFVGFSMRRKRTHPPEHQAL